MARVFITGSADGLGHMTAGLLLHQGHQVVLHARNAERAQHTLHTLPTAEKVLVADLSDIEETKQLAVDVNALGSFDAIIHNAGVYKATGKQILTVNTLASYMLTCLIKKPKRLVYLSSGMHTQGKALVTGTGISYADSKLHVVILSMAVARKWPTVYANAVDPGWVATKMGGPGAPDDLEKGFQTQAWLAVSEEEQAKVRGRYFYHQREKNYLRVADDIHVQEEFLGRCEKITGISFTGLP